MKVKCLYNTGRALMKYQGEHLTTSKQLLTDSKNRSFWCTGDTRFGELEIGKEYLVMGIVLRDGLPHYLIDDGQTYPYLLFEVIDSKVSPNWYFRAFTKDDHNYNNREAVWGYYELCFIDDHFMQLLDMNKDAVSLFYKRRLETENLSSLS